jgi:hypothetical protein
MISSKGYEGSVATALCISFEGKTHLKLPYSFVSVGSVF